jgi:hypothetical protein
MVTAAVAAAAALTIQPSLASGHPNHTPDRTIAVDPSAPQTWDGALASGANVEYDGSSGEPCGKTPDSYCDITLLNVNVAPSFWDTRGGGVQVDVTDFVPNPASDFDLYIYESDANARVGRLVASSADIPGAEESTTIDRASGFYLVQVVYFAVTASRYKGSAKFIFRGAIPDVDDPAGFQDHLASDPGAGWRSRSEMHLAQNPLDPSMLIGASKFYNRDPDSLPEYEFKLGSYASFDGGVIWSDLGQIGVCPPSQAPPESWPNNTCYPDEDPNRDGLDDDDERMNRGGGGDFGEEYITSDPWVDFDDEGNAYAMALDHPPFRGDPEGLGWGMSFHRWESVSPEDVASGNTWGPRIPINAYPSRAEQEIALDDKNTFAVNNAGPDRDGRTGIMIACWGQNIDPLIKQQTVCERSTDGGRSWPDRPVPISGGEQLVIGVHVVADTRDENTFYATWLQYATSILAGPDTMQFTKTTDGGRTWQPARPVATLTGIPRTFPGQSFRNLSLPIMAVGPSGELYITYADYRAAPQPGDEDRQQSDIMLIRSTDGGSSWSQPAKVNQDAGNADQFQQYVVVNPQGEVHVAYFDRRHDLAAPPDHPGNFYIDTYLSRSSDQGRTFADTRVSHDMWDPTINPPISPSGHFIGDYQGLVADDCFTIPFINDTHLANDPARDPNFDSGFPRSRYQEAFAWRIPNERGFAEGRCRAAPSPLVTPEGLPRVRLIAPRLASNVSRDPRFRVRIVAGAANISHYELQVRNLRRRKWRRLTSSLRAAQYRFAGYLGANYRFRARAVTRDGRRGPWDYERTIVPLDDVRRPTPPRYQGRWRRPRSRRAWMRSFSRSLRRGQSLRQNFRARRVYVIGRKSPRGGKALVILNGRRRVVDFYARRPRNRRVIASMRARRRVDTLRVVNLGRRNRRSRGRRVEIDAIGVLLSKKQPRRRRR